MTTPRWYMVNKMGMATLCANKADAEKEAADAQSVWPHMGPHRAVQLVEVADVEALRTGYAAARLEIESLQARIKTMAEEHADELMVAHLDGRMRAEQPAGAQQPGAGTWTPLPGTLPEPGKPVLLDIGKEYPIRAMWAAKHTLEVGVEDDSGFGEYDEATGTYYCPEGWYEWNEHEEIHWAVNKTPTAWCELPPNGGASHGQAPAQAAPAAVAGPWSAGELDGNWIHIDHKDHAGVIRIVWKMEGDARNPVCEARAMAVIAALNAYAEIQDKLQKRMLNKPAAGAPTPPAQAADSVLEDAARLDWLDEDAGNHVTRVGKTWYTRPTYGHPYRKHKNLRAAIDAARAAQEGKSHGN